MARALELAWQAAGETEPNPLVGAIVVSDGDVVGEGFHHRCGEAHAEVLALDAAGERANGATMYVTLEPCAHFGRTPPCTDAILASGVTRVVIPALDPDPRVFGHGVEILRRAGLGVDIGCGSRAAILQNIGYYRQRLGLGPTVTLKMAVSLDGKIASAPGKRDNITGADALRFAHRLRAAHDCVLIGVDTMLIDKPILDCRFLDSGRVAPPPVPVVLDSQLRTPPDNNWSQNQLPFVVLCGPDHDRDRRRRLEDAGATVGECPRSSDGISVDGAIAALTRMGHDRVLVEGGARVFSSFISAGFWDGLYLFQSKALFGDGGVPLYRGPTVDRSVTGHSVDSLSVGFDALHRFVGERSWSAITAHLGE